MRSLSWANALVIILAVLIAPPALGTPAAAAPTGIAACESTIGPGIPPPALSDLPKGLPGFHAAWFGQSGYMALCPGDSKQATVAYYNVGSRGWVNGRMGEVAYLGTSGPEPGQDGASVLGGDGQQGSPSTGWPRYNRIAQQPADYVGPTQVAWFQFMVKAPATAGVYVVSLRPMIEGAQWMEDFGVYWVVVVKNADGTLPGASSRPPCTTCWPLNGAPLAAGQPNVHRRSLNVRIDNAPAARPHSGTSQADVIFETLVEAGITRYEAIFHSQDPATIGSIRSARLSDREITPMVRGALAYSGATIEETRYIQEDAAAGKYIDLNANYPCCSNAYYRRGADDAGNQRVSPYNLYASSASLRQATNAAGGGAPVDVPSWGFLDSVNHIGWAGGMYGSGFASALRIPYEHSNGVRYAYDSATRTYARWQYDPNLGREVREVDAAGNVAIAPRNIVVVFTDVWGTAIIEDSYGSTGVNIRTTGTGAVSIFRDGRRQDGTWSRATLTDAWTFTSRYGERILLSPGQTWVHMIPSTWQVPSSP